MSAIEKNPVEFFVDVLDLLVDPVHHGHELVLSNKLFVNRHLYRINPPIKFHVSLMRPSKSATSNARGTKEK
jgi:hypothetical protein